MRNAPSLVSCGITDPRCRCTERNRDRTLRRGCRGCCSADAGLRGFDRSAHSDYCPSAPSPLCRQVESARRAAQSHGLSVRFWGERERERPGPSPPPSLPFPGEGAARGTGGDRQRLPSPTRGLRALQAVPDPGVAQCVKPSPTQQAGHGMWAWGIAQLFREWAKNALCDRERGSRKGRCPGLCRNAGLGDSAWKGGGCGERKGICFQRGEALF